MQPMMENWAHKGEWIEGISWKRKDGLDRSTLGYHEMLFSFIHVGKHPLVRSPISLSSNTGI